MGFFSKLKSAVGIGNPKLMVQLDATQVKRGEKITGKLQLTGTSGEVPVQSLIVEFIEVLTERRYDDNLGKYVESKNEKGTLGRVVIDKKGQLVKEGETMNESFEILVSSGAYPTAHPTSYILRASADVPGLDPKHSQELFVM